MRKRCLSGKMQQRRAQRDLEHLTVRQTGVAPEGYGQPFTGKLLLGLTQHLKRGLVPGRFSTGFTVTLDSREKLVYEGTI